MEQKLILSKEDILQLLKHTYETMGNTVVNIQWKKDKLHVDLENKWVAEPSKKPEYHTTFPGPGQT